MSLLIAFALQVSHYQNSVETATERFFNWMDSVGYTSELNKPFVKVPSKDEEWEPSTYGFLLAEDRDSFEAMAPNLAITTFHKIPTKNERHLGKYELASLKQLANNLLHKLIEKPENYPNQWLPLGVYELEALAWICKRKGLDSESTSFIGLAAKQKIFQSGKGELSGAEAIAEAKRSVLFQMMHPLILRFEYPGFSLSELHDRFTDVAKRLKNLEGAKDFVDISTTLGKMVTEERTHGHRDIKKLSKEQQIQELIWKLRYVGLENSPGGSSINDLVKIGDDAIPYLKAALKDQSYTRKLNWENKGSNSRMEPTEIIRVCDYAKQIIGYIEKHKKTL